MSARREVLHLRHVPWRKLKVVVVGVWREVIDDRLGIVAAGVAFYAFLSLFPAISAVVSLWALFADPDSVQRQIASLDRAIPASALELLQSAADHIISNSSQTLGWGVVISVLLAVWAANKGLRGLIQGVVIAFDEGDGVAERGFLREYALSTFLTGAAVLLALFVTALVVVLPLVLNWLGLDGISDFLLRFLRWPLVCLAIMVALATVYRIGPPRRSARWHWISPGSLIATSVWLAGSALFSVYVQGFGSYNEMYGSVAAVAVTLMWFYISAFIVLLGAEIDSETSKVILRHRQGP